MSKIREITDKMVEECAKKRAELIETMLVPFLEHTGLKPDEIELVETIRTKDSGFGIETVWFFRKRTVK